MGNLIAPMIHTGENCTVTTDQNDTTVLQYPAVNSIRLALFVLEMVINASVLASSALFALLLCRIHSFSKTMKVIFWNMLFAADGIAATRLFLLIPQILSDGTLFNWYAFTKAAQVFHDICINVNTFNQLAITLACMFSRLTKRDSSSKFLFVANWTIQILWPWFFTALFLFLENRGIFTTIPQFICLELMNILSWIIFIMLYFSNKGKYKTMCASNLDEKYQVTVKIRNLRTLLFLSAMASARNLITMTLLMFIVLYLGPNCLFLLKMYCDHVYDLTVTVYSLLLIVPVVITHAEFRKQFRMILCGSTTKCTVITNRVHTVSTSDPLPRTPRNVFGEHLVVSQNAEEYYRRLAESWGQLPAPAGNTVATTTRRAATVPASQQRGYRTNSGGHEQLRRTLDLVKWRRRAHRHSQQMLDVELPDNFLHNSFCEVRQPTAAE